MKEVKNREVQFPNRYRLLEVDQNVYDILPEQGQVVAEGTPIDKELFDSIQDDLDNKVNVEPNKRLITTDEATQIQTNKNNLANHKVSSDHDVRYYTKTESNSQLAGKVDKTDSRLSDARPASDVHPWAKKETLQATDLPTVPANKGGTGQTTYAIGDILYCNEVGKLAKLPIGSNGQVLKVVGGKLQYAADNDTIYTHPNYTPTVTQDTVLPTNGKFWVIDSINVNTQGHVISYNLKEVTINRATYDENGDRIATTYVKRVNMPNTIVEKIDIDGDVIEPTNGTVTIKTHDVLFEGNRLIDTDFKTVVTNYDPYKYKALEIEWGAEHSGGLTYFNKIKLQQSPNVSIYPREAVGGFYSNTTSASHISYYTFQIRLEPSNISNIQVGRAVYGTDLDNPSPTTIYLYSIKGLYY